VVMEEGKTVEVKPAPDKKPTTKKPTAKKPSKPKKKWTTLRN